MSSRRAQCSIKRRSLTRFSSRPASTSLKNTTGSSEGCPMWRQRPRLSFIKQQPVHQLREPAVQIMRWDPLGEPKAGHLFVEKQLLALYLPATNTGSATAKTFPKTKSLPCIDSYCSSNLTCNGNKRGSFIYEINDRNKLLLFLDCGQFRRPQ